MDIRVIASGSSGNSYLIGDGRTRLLLDAGIPFRRIQIGCSFRTSSIDGCLVTHRHGDHAAAIPKLLRRGIAVYSNADVAGVYEGVQELTARKEHTIGTMRILPFMAEHDVPCYGYQVTSEETGEKLVYITDSAYVRYTFTGLTHIMIEANYDEDIMIGNVRDEKVPLSLAERVAQTHMSIGTLLDLLRANDMTKVRQIYLLHLSDMSSDAERFKKLVQQETGAEVYIA
ncbi:MBL fold metallo-hydrolase [Selenomonas dianae]|uniref:MBL fold metallo-hydrolase n=1 Tax=Selenomonas dianae TaxID=135079 RepID=UPI00272C9CE5|nr:MBL fold metallo-hydrolase [Selenomonas dianae]WLD81439.1 MBL fold metallo-hydrolase [Selenomonas dianae]